MVRAAVVVYFVLSRLAYVGWVGWALRREDRDGWFTRRDGIEPGWRRFRRTASTLMNNDGVAFVLLALITRNTLTIDLPGPVLLAGGAALAAVGVGIKLWAAASLGDRGYHWHNFFDPSDPIAPVAPGPYRYFRNPMYTLGYLQTYGLALMLRSAPALVASAFAQAAVLVFNYVVERPHYLRLLRQTGEGR